MENLRRGWRIWPLIGASVTSQQQSGSHRLRTPTNLQLPPGHPRRTPRGSPTPQRSQDQRQATVGWKRLDPIRRVDLRWFDGPPAPRTAQRSARCADLWVEGPVDQHPDLGRVAASPSGTALWGIHPIGPGCPCPGGLQIQWISRIVGQCLAVVVKKVQRPPPLVTAKR